MPTALRSSPVAPREAHAFRERNHHGRGRPRPAVRPPVLAQPGPPQGGSLLTSRPGAPSTRAGHVDEHASRVHRRARRPAASTTAGPRRAARCAAIDLLEDRGGELDLTVIVHAQPVEHACPDEPDPVLTDPEKLDGHHRRDRCGAVPAHHHRGEDDRLGGHREVKGRARAIPRHLTVDLDPLRVRGRIEVADQARLRQPRGGELVGCVLPLLRTPGRSRSARSGVERSHGGDPGEIRRLVLGRTPHPSCRDERTSRPRPRRRSTLPSRLPSRTRLLSRTRPSSARSSTSLSRPRASRRSSPPSRLPVWSRSCPARARSPSSHRPTRRSPRSLRACSSSCSSRRTSRCSSAS